MSQMSRPAPTIICRARSEEHTSELQSRLHFVCRLLLAKRFTCSSADARCKSSAEQCSTVLYRIPQNARNASFVETLGDRASVAPPCVFCCGWDLYSAAK